MKLVKIIGIIVLLLLVCVTGAGLYVKTALPNLGPAPDLKIEPTAARIERGRYLATNVSVCVDCHSTRDWSRFAGPMVAGSEGSGGEVFDQKMGFPGSFRAPNITPDALGSWTDGEILRAVTIGVSKDGHALFPLMPYKHVGSMDTEDVYSIIAYIRTLQPVKHKVPRSEPDFPVNFLINTMPEKAVPGERPSEDDPVAYGRYLVNAAACVDCHSKTDKGSILPGTEFGGGMAFRQPGGVVHAANITMDDETGIGRWDEALFIRRFKQYRDSGYVPAKLGPKDLNSPMPWMMYSGMSEKDLAAVYAFLKTLPPISNSVKHFERRP